MSRKRRTAKIISPGQIPLPSQVAELFEAHEKARRQGELDEAYFRMSPREKLDERNRLKELRIERYGR